jgi:ATP-binding cassette, subfamily B, bacterial
MKGAAAHPQPKTAPPAQPPLPTWRYLWKLVLVSPGLYLLFGLLEILFFAAFPQVSALIVRSFFNSLTEQAPAAWGPYALAALFAGVAVAKVGVVFADIVVYFRLRYTFEALLRKNLFARILERPGARAVPHSPGEAVSRFREDVNEVAFFMAEMLTLIGFGLFTIVALVVMSRVSMSITLIVFLPLVVVIALANFAMQRVQIYREASREATGKVTGFIGEMFGAVQAVKVAAAEANMLEHFDRLNEDRRQTTVKDRLFNELLDSLFRNTANIGTGIVLLAAGGAMRTGEFTVGDLALFVFYLVWVTDFTAILGSKIAWYKQAGVSFRRMHDLLQGTAPERLVQPGNIYLSGPLPELPQIERVPGDLLESLEVRGLSYHHPESGHGFEDASFSLERGSFTVITGRVGSGKTTLLKALLGLLPPDEGEVLWNGERVRSPGDFFTPPRAAFTPQAPVLFSESLRDNILMGESDQGLEEALRLAVFNEDIQSLDRGLDTMVGAKGVKLSGGQRQRAAAARMFVRQPELLVFDDISSALDVETERRLWEGIFREPARTCLAVSHRRPALRRADKIIVLKEGRIAGQGSLEELLLNCPAMQSIWHGDTED